MSKFKGVIVYEILPNGCLNGVFSNDDQQTNNEIFNEIARKKDNPIEEHDSNNYQDIIFGLYTCCYTDSVNGHICDLRIKPGATAQYDFVWYEKNTNEVKWKGIGWRTRQNQITVSYKEI